MNIVNLHHGECLKVLSTLPGNSVDSIVTDPPYGLSFMGKKWDYDVPATEVWAECLRVLKPGGHLLAFAGTRTQHRMAVRIEDAGFEIRDMIAWVYGSGFPKSLDVSKAIDKLGGVHPNWQPEKYNEALNSSSFTHADVDRHLGLKSSSCYWARTDHRRCTPLYEHWIKARDFLGLDDNFTNITENAKREVIGHRDQGFAPGSNAVYGDYSGDTRITVAATEAARQWQGWGTALKPALEPITVARKPLMGTVAENVLEHGTGAINVDGCRVQHGEVLRAGAGATWDAMHRHEGREGEASAERRYTDKGGTDFAMKPGPRGGDAMGRWPANLIHDGSDEVLAGFPETKSGMMKAGTPYPGGSVYGAPSGATKADTIGDSGSSARFFYCAKASKRDRDEGLEGFEKRQANQIASKDGGGGGWSKDADKNPNNPRANVHPTVKPTDLMRYLCRLVTPPGGVVLDPFMGSGSTGKAAMLEGFGFFGIEREAEYLEIARARINAANDNQPRTDDLFEGME
jgi:DNA modification methylase